MRNKREIALENQTTSMVKPSIILLPGQHCGDRHSTPRFPYPITSERFFQMGKSPTEPFLLDSRTLLPCFRLWCLQYYAAQTLTNVLNFRSNYMPGPGQCSRHRDWPEYRRLEVKFRGCIISWPDFHERTINASCALPPSSNLCSRHMTFDRHKRLLNKAARKVFVQIHKAKQKGPIQLSFQLQL